MVLEREPGTLVGRKSEVLKVIYRQLGFKFISISIVKQSFSVLVQTLSSFISDILEKSPPFPPFNKSIFEYSWAYDDAD